LQEKSVERQKHQKRETAKENARNKGKVEQKKMTKEIKHQTNEI
jgi:hypothetical protein